MFKWLERRRQRKASLTALFFYAAVSAYLEQGDRTAYAAAIVVCEAAGYEQRVLLFYLDLMIEYIRDRSPKHVDALTKMSSMIRDPQHVLGMQVWLQKKDRECWTACRRRDISFFKRRYPDLNIMTMEFFHEQTEKCMAMFNKPEVRQNLSKNYPDLYEGLINVGIINPEK